MINTDKLKGAIISMGLTIPQFCSLMKISVASYYRKIRSNSFTIDEADRAVNILRLDAKQAIEIFFANLVA